MAWYWIFIAFLALYAPTFWDLFNGLWRTDQNAHGPIVLAISIWLVVHRARLFAQIPEVERTPLQPASALGWSILIFGLLLYIVGRSQAFYIFELGSLIPMVAGTILVLFGPRVLSYFWFVLFFMLFMIPLPGSLVDTVTQPMKIFVSWSSEHILYSLGYPIARSGVVLSIGQYKLLVADACAGLNSLFTLEALGLLYMNVVRHSSFARNVMLATLIVPISLATNVIRVVLLSLITYYFGDEAGQGFVHSFSGMLLFMTALVIIMGVDSLLRVGIKVHGRIAGSA